MGYLKPVTVTREPLPSDPAYWVEFKSHIPYGAMKAATSSAVTFDADGAAQADSAKIMQNIAMAYVSAWNVDDEAGAVLPLTAENLDALQEVDGKFIQDYAQDRISRKTAEQKN